MERDRTDRGAPLGCWTPARPSAGPFGGGWDGRRRAPSVGGRVERAAAAEGHICRVFPERWETVAGECLGCLTQFAIDVWLSVHRPRRFRPSSSDPLQKLPESEVGRDGPLGRSGSALGGPTLAESNLAVLGAGTPRARQTSMAEHGWRSLEWGSQKPDRPRGGHTTEPPALENSRRRPGLNREDEIRANSVPRHRLFADSPDRRHQARERRPARHPTSVRLVVSEGPRPIRLDVPWVPRRDPNPDYSWRPRLGHRQAVTEPDSVTDSG